MIPVSIPTLEGNELTYITECINTNWISSKGKFVNEFEGKFSKYCDKKYGVSVVNGTCAIHLALLAAGIRSGDEVIVPTFNTVASINPIIYAGAIPVFVDSELYTWNIDPTKIEESISPKTKAILVVHLYGHPCNMDPIIDIAEKHNLIIIEDAAEAHGALYKDKKAGSFGLLSCFSFYANKIITCGEGGMVLTNDEKLFEKLRNLKDLAYGIGENRFVHEDIGYNYRMTNLQAAIGLAQLENIEKNITERRRVASTYNKYLSNFDLVILPPDLDWAFNVYWMYTIILKSEVKIKRNKLIKDLLENGIDTRPTFYPAHLQKIYQKYNSGKLYPNAEFLGFNGINLPTSNNLDEKTIKEISSKVQSLII